MINTGCCQYMVRAKARAPVTVGICPFCGMTASFIASCASPLVPDIRVLPGLVVLPALDFER